MIELTVKELYQRAIALAEIEGGLSRVDFADGVLSTIGLKKVEGPVYVDRAGRKWQWTAAERKYKSTGANND